LIGLKNGRRLLMWISLAHLVLGRPTIKQNVEAGMGMGGNENELSGAIREWE